MAIKFPLGIDSFEKLRKSGCYYVDKTGFISKILQDEFEVNLVTRPRRFGKSLMMSMLEDFFDISKKSKADFAELEISENVELCEEWMNQWPVIFLTLKSVEGRTFGLAYERLEILMADVCKKYAFLEESYRVDADDKACFRRIKSGTANEAEISSTIYLLMRMMHAHYGKKVILLLDEYDVPLAKAGEADYYVEMMDVIRGMLGKALKTNEYLKFAVITGCLKIAKESIFTGTNNFVSDTISSDRFDEYFGFTESDVRKLLEDSEFMDHAEEVRVWYDGYRFGATEVYCPWDVLNHVASLQFNPNKKPQNYWGSTSHNGVIYRFISREDLDVSAKFEILMSGGCLVEQISENLTYDTLKSTEENLWSLLYLTGYLTQTDIPEEFTGDTDDYVALRIPNEEVKSIFKTAIVEWFQDTVKAADRKELFDAMWNGNAARSEELISELLFETISYFDYQESYYHAFVAGIFTGAGYVVESNYERGNGRPDVMVKDKRNRRILVIEVKHAKREEDLPKERDEAVAQIFDKKYLQGLEKGYRSVTGYGIAFWAKECMIKKAEK